MMNKSCIISTSHFVFFSSTEQFSSANTKEKQEKLDFLDKLISYLAGAAGVSINVKPSKIVAGLEPEKTRYLLQIYTVVAETKDVAVSAPVSPAYATLSDEIESHNEEKAFTTSHVTDNSANPDNTPNTSMNDETTSPSVTLKTYDAAPVVHEEKIESPSLRDETSYLDTTEELELPDFGSWLGHANASDNL